MHGTAHCHMNADHKHCVDAIHTTVTASPCGKPTSVYTCGSITLSEVCGGITKDGMYKSKVDPCGVCSLRA